MRLLFLIASISLFSITSVCAALRPEQPAPDFTTQATLGGKLFQFSLAAALKHGPVVLYFYPAAFTSGCTEEAHDFAEAIPAFQALGATVIGVSGDPIEKLNRFSVSACASRFALGSDPHRTIMKQYDAVLIPLTSYASRTSYVITPDNRILYSYSAMSPDRHVANSLTALRAWRSTHPQSSR